MLPMKTSRYGHDDEVAPQVSCLAGLYTYSIPDVPPGSEPVEQRKEDGFGSRFQQHDGVRIVEKSPTKCRLQTRGVHSRKEKGGRERLEKLVSNQFILKKKGHPTPPYIGQGGCHPPLHFRGGTNPKGGGFWRR